MDEYFLPSHVHCCRRGDAFVFLDLKQDDYSLVAGPAASELNALMNADATVAIKHLGELEQGGLLTKDRATGRPLQATECDVALEALLDDATAAANIRIVDYWNFFAACTAATLRLRWQPIEKTVKAVAKRKAKHAANTAIELAKARHLMAVFQRLRSLFPANYLCLFDSLALIEFLARYRTFPTWVFGVRLEPWGAHCWIQQGPFTFNEGAEEAASYTPIMAI